MGCKMGGKLFDVPTWNGVAKMSGNWAFQLVDEREIKRKEACPTTDLELKSVENKLSFHSVEQNFCIIQLNKTFLWFGWTEHPHNTVA